MENILKIYPSDKKFFPEKQVLETDVMQDLPDFKSYGSELEYLILLLRSAANDEKILFIALK